jgi:MurNAc alpha-1-phosphate uridylyltransferase
MIKKAFVLAAGLGTRMRPLTDNIPKPMIEVYGRTMIDRSLDNLVAYGVEEVVVNTHYKAEVLHEHLAKRKDIKIIISHETERLETGGGLQYARDKLGDEPIFVITTDVICEKSGLDILAAAHKADTCGTLLLQKVDESYGYDGKGDFELSNGFIKWREPEKAAPYVFTGIQILNPKVLDRDAVKQLGKIFALNKIYTLYLNEFRGIVNPGKWYHIGTPDALTNLKL